MSDEQRPAPEGAAQDSGQDAVPGAVNETPDLQDASLAELQARCAELEARCAALQDQHLRALAETENVRRRAHDDVAKAHKYGIESFAEALLPVRDSLELALVSESPTVENMKEGVEATLRLMANVFEKNKLLVIDPAGQKFDPNLHQAISMVPASSANPPATANHVVAVLQKGYLINDRVLRPALVTVAQG
jgi:molecular chaperone GrpE